MRIMSLLILAICLNGAAFGQSGAAEHHSSDTALRLYAGLDKQSVRVGEEIHLKVRIKNVSHDSIAIYKNRGWIDPFIIEVTDENGRRPDMREIFDDFSAAHRKKEDYVVLHPKEEHQEAITLNLKDYYQNGGLPGEYHLTIVYRGTCVREKAPEGVRLWMAEDPELTAGALKIKLIGR